MDVLVHQFFCAVIEFMADLLTDLFLDFCHSKTIFAWAFEAQIRLFFRFEHWRKKVMKTKHEELCQFIFRVQKVKFGTMSHDMLVFNMVLL
jgi:hypothetical protein